VNAADLVSLHVLKLQRITKTQGLSVNFEDPLTAIVLDKEIVTERDEVFDHPVSIASLCALGHKIGRLFRGSAPSEHRSPLSETLGARSLIDESWAGGRECG
jgi:hypothetical protein